MARVRVEAEGNVNAPAERVYRLIADYRVHHPAFLPPQFSDFAVEEGGVGAGTIMHFTMKAGGRTMSFRQRVDEPDPGRVLTETSIGTQDSTTFTVTPQGNGCTVHILTEYEGQSGIQGKIERYVAPWLLGRIFKDELRRLDAYAQQQTG